MRFGTLILICIVIWFIAGGFRYDSTDNAQTGQRSGLMLYTDHQTGCEYIAPFFGGMLPRIDKEGNHLGCK